MFTRPILAAALAMLVWSAPGPASSQAVVAKSHRALDLDAAPSAEVTPDPLAQPEKDAPAPLAPGMPVNAAAVSPQEQADPIVVLVRQRLNDAAARSIPGHRDDVAGLAAFYASEAGRSIWTGKAGFTARAAAAMAEIRKADDWGLKAAAFDLPVLPGSAPSPEVLADAEIKLSMAVLTYARHARGGRVDPRSISRLLDRKPSIFDPKSLLLAVAGSDAVDAYLRGLHPKHPQFEKLRQALLATRGATTEETPAGNVKIPAGPLIKPGRDHAHVALVRQRLGLPPPSEKETVYDDALVEAVKGYQRQRGLAPTGNINASTREALNDTRRGAASTNVKRILANMERWRWMPEDLGAFYVWDSVPEQMTSVVDAGKVVLSEKIVVGKPGSPTPIFSADMQFIIFHPSWGVPPGMKTHELWPQLRDSGGGWFSTKPLASSVLNAHGLRVTRGGQPVNPDSINWSSVDIRGFEFTQPPGPRNVLGIVKFRFPNKHDVYMHDTPERHLFGGAVRAFSHGCMRVQNPVRLAEVLLARDKGWPAEKVQEYVKRGGEIVLSTPIPVHITYFTAIVDDDGKVQYRPDIYGLDAKVASAIEGQAVHLVAATDPDETAAPSVRAPSRPVRKKAKEQAAFNPFAALFGN
ncbi:MAG: L,D-transpeptidase family protein [Hyphomicrobiaceae bacterium]|nr:MAG: L,D-transpeptidase family protein [Hyphomicrobiaceae bacterium]